MKRESPDQTQFFFVPTIVPRGDGSFVITPGKPVQGRKKLTPQEAAKISGLSSDTIIRLYHAEMIEGEQPSPRKYFIYEDSLQEHIRKTRDREFWESKNKQTYLKAI